MEAEAAKTPLERFLLCPPPKHFKPAGDVIWAEFSEAPDFVPETRRARGRRAQGIRYEKRAQEYLLEALEEGYCASPWIRFRSEQYSRPRYCQPDGVLFDIEGGKLTVFEIKLQHTIDAWWQLEHLYLPVLRHLFPPKWWSYATCEFVKWYDPATAFPVRPALCADLRDIRPEQFGVHIWNP